MAYKRYGKGDFPPFGKLDVGDVVEGKLRAVRDFVRREKKSERIQVVLDIELETDVKLSQGSVKKKTVKRVAFEAGTSVSIGVNGNLSVLLKDAVKETTGEVLDKDADFTSEFVKCLVGKVFKLERIADDTMKKGPHAGEAVTRYTLDERVD